MDEYWENLQPFECIDDIPSPPIVPEEEYKLYVEKLISCGAIPKKDLVPGKKYIGYCRNARVATWDGEKFTYPRTKFWYEYDEEINHFEDDDGYDLFITVWEYTKENYEAKVKRRKRRREDLGGTEDS